MNKKIIDYYCKDTGTYYTMKKNSLLYKVSEDEEWGEVMVEHCICEGLNLYKVYEHFGKTEIYTEIVFNELQRWIKD